MELQTSGWGVYSWPPGAKKKFRIKDQTLVRIFSVAILLFASKERLMSQTNQEEKVRNVVLIHGGFVDGSGWEVSTRF